MGGNFSLDMKTQIIIKGIRKTWAFSPVIRVVQSRKKYSRKVKHKIRES
jgi:hypothetical protein